MGKYVRNQFGILVLYTRLALKKCFGLFGSSADNLLFLVTMTPKTVVLLNLKPSPLPLLSWRIHFEVNS